MEKVKLELEAVTAGMRLAESLTDANGVTLMPAGIRLTPLFITKIRKWGVAAVEVLAEDAAAPKEGGEAARPAAPRAAAPDGAAMSPEMEAFAQLTAGEVSAWFVNAKDNPLMAKLRVAAVRALVSHGQTGWLNLMRRKAAGGKAGPDHGH